MTGLSSFSLELTEEMATDTMDNSPSRSTRSQNKQMSDRNPMTESGTVHRTIRNTFNHNHFLINLWIIVIKKNCYYNTFTYNLLDEKDGKVHDKLLYEKVEKEETYTHEERTESKIYIY